MTEAGEEQKTEPGQTYTERSSAPETTPNLPTYVGNGSLIEKLTKLNGNYTKTDAFFLRDREGNPITDPAKAIYEVSGFLAWAYRVAGESNEPVRDMAERLYWGFVETGLDGLIRGLEGKPPKPIEIPEGMPGYMIHQMTPAGRLHVHLTVDPLRNYNPLETFLSVGKAGEKELAQTEALGRLVSYILRRSGTMGEVLDQIGGLSSSGRGIMQKEGFISTIELGVEMALRKYYLRREVFGMENILTGVFNPKYVKEVVTDIIKEGEFPQFVVAVDGRKIPVTARELVPKKNGSVGHRAYELLLPRTKSPEVRRFLVAPEPTEVVEPIVTTPNSAEEAKEREKETESQGEIILPKTTGLEICPSCYKKSYKPDSGCGICLSCSYSECG